jgi:hypothetical protein
MEKKRNELTMAEFMAADDRERLRQVKAIFDELERDGLICRTGQLRDGWPLYVATNKSRAKDEVERLERFDTGTISRTGEPLARLRRPPMSRTIAEPAHGPLRLVCIGYLRGRFVRPLA